MGAQRPWLGPEVLSQFSPAPHTCRRVHEPPLQTSATFWAFPLHASSPGVEQAQPSVPSAPVPVGLHRSTAASPESFEPSAPVSDASASDDASPESVPSRAPSALPPLLPCVPSALASAGTGRSPSPAMDAHAGVRTRALAAARAYHARVPLP